MSYRYTEKIMGQDRFWELLSLQLSGEATSAELGELAEILRKHPELGLDKEILTSIWKNKEGDSVDKKNRFNRHMQRLSNHLADPALQYGEAVLPDEEITAPASKRFNNKIRNLVITLAIAASLVIAFILFAPGQGNSPSQDSHAHNTISTKRGSKSKIILPDGTQVWLNADSRLKYDENFQGKIREVELTGEAFFDVTRDETRPFIIHTETIDVKVLGTAFNVRSYAEEKNTETSLIHGSVEVTLLKSPDKKKIILEPLDKLIVANKNDPEQNEQNKIAAKTNTPVMTLKKVNFKQKDTLAVETLWTRNQLAFDNESLDEIAAKIERWYDVNVTITSERLKKEAYTATFDNIPLVDVMEALEHSGGFRYTFNNKELTISPR